MKNNYRVERVSYDRPRRKGKTIPDQSMSIQEIVRRFVRGLPADVEHRNPIYVDQSEVDLEKVSRLDFGEKHALAQEMSAQNQRFVDAVANEQARRVKEQSDAEAEEKREMSRSGIGALDNTMPDDTNADSQSVGDKKPRKK